MSSQGLITLMSFAEFGLWAALCLMFWAQNLDRRFPAMGAYLVLRLVSMPVLLVLFYGQSQHWFSGRAYLCYFCVYWAVYIASAVMIFFICQEVFRSALSAFTGLQRLGIVVFRWAALASTFASFSTLSFAHLQISMVPLIAYRLMRSISILEICLLGFLCLSMNALRLSTRSMTFGIALGLGLMSSSDFILASFVSRSSTWTSPLQFLCESLILVSLVNWFVYAALPEKARQPLMLPVSSTILRWNEIASVLGYTGTQVAVQPAGGFVLNDVERVAERMPTRNLKFRDRKSVV